MKLSLAFRGALMLLVLAAPVFGQDTPPPETPVPATEAPVTEAPEGDTPPPPPQVEVQPLPEGDTPPPPQGGEPEGNNLPILPPPQVENPPDSLEEEEPVPSPDELSPSGECINECRHHKARKCHRSCEALETIVEDCGVQCEQGDFENMLGTCRQLCDGYRESKTEACQNMCSLTMLRQRQGPPPLPPFPGREGSDEEDRFGLAPPPPPPGGVRGQRRSRNNSNQGGGPKGHKGHKKGHGPPPKRSREGPPRPKRSGPTGRGPSPKRDKEGPPPRDNYYYYN